MTKTLILHHFLNIIKCQLGETCRLLVLISLGLSRIYEEVTREFLEKGQSSSRRLGEIWLVESRKSIKIIAIKGGNFKEQGLFFEYAAL